MEDKSTKEKKGKSWKIIIYLIFVLLLPSIFGYIYNSEKIETNNHSRNNLQRETSKQIITNTNTNNIQKMSRSILKSFLAVEQSEGVGARVRRSIGTREMRNFLPFLMLDHFSVKPPAGFPDHPHHGQETITYVTEGQIAHEDFTGSKGILRSGDLQFMTAGKGIVHSEIPVDMGDGKPTVGLQLWVDLPVELKNCNSRYRDLRREEIPEANPSDHLKVKVISGNSYNVESLHNLAYTPVNWYQYMISKKNIEFEQKISMDFNAFIYILKGSISINDKIYKQHSAIFFKPDSELIKGVSADDDVEFAIIGGLILDQPVVQYGPFVETSNEKIMEVIKNYQLGVNGFENAPTWRSSISDGINKNRAAGILKESNLSD